MTVHDRPPEMCGSFMDMMHEPRLLIGRLWVLTNLALFGFVFLAIATADANQRCSPGQKCDRSLGFAAVWTLLTCTALSIGGTQLLRSKTVRAAERKTSCCCLRARAQRKMVEGRRMLGVCCAHLRGRLLAA